MKTKLTYKSYNVSTKLLALYLVLNVVVLQPTFGRALSFKKSIDMERSSIDLETDIELEDCYKYSDLDKNFFSRTHLFLFSSYTRSGHSCFFVPPFQYNEGDNTVSYPPPEAV